MDEIKVSSVPELLELLKQKQGIHVECNYDCAQEIFRLVRTLKDQSRIGYVIEADAGYERYSVKANLRFFAEIFGKKLDWDKLSVMFGIKEIGRKLLRNLTPGERVMVKLARLSMQDADIYFLEDVLHHLDTHMSARALEWIAGCYEMGICFLTVNSSLRNALLMPGTSFYVEGKVFCQVEQDEEMEEALEEDDIRILKIPAKSGSSTILFEPKDIDFVESMNKCNYVSVRGSLFQVTQTMDELEETLGKSGFFRCHRSYIVNMQRVEQIERPSKNSFTLLLDNKEQSRIPLSKGRVEEMKVLFGW